MVFSRNNNNGNSNQQIIMLMTIIGTLTREDEDHNVLISRWWVSLARVCLTGGPQLTLIAAVCLAPHPSERSRRSVVIVRVAAVVVQVALRRGPVSVHRTVHAWMVSRHHSVLTGRR